MRKRVRVLSPEFPIHVCGRVNNRERFPVPNALAWELFSDYLHILRFQFNIRIISFVLMPNHFHLICLDPDLQLSKAMNFFMRETSREMAICAGRINRIWGAPFFSSVIPDPLYYLHAYKYCYRNPVAANIVQKVEDYPWSTLQMLLGRRRGIIPLQEDQTLFNSPDDTVRWLNEAYAQEESTLIQASLRKKNFKFPMNPMNRKKFPLDSLDSISLRSESQKGRR